MCIHCGAGEHEDCNCEEHSNEIRVLQEQIERLTAEVERHRMTAEERHAAGECAADSRGVAVNYSESDAASQSLRGYLARTESQEPSNG